mgnify:CR=1 FL=1
MLMYGLYTALRIPKTPRQGGSILAPTIDFKDW